jgi:hypothetical protein
LKSARRITAVRASSTNRLTRPASTPTRLPRQATPLFRVDGGCAFANERGMTIRRKVIPLQSATDSQKASTAALLVIRAPIEGLRVAPSQGSACKSFGSASRNDW